MSGLEERMRRLSHREAKLQCKVQRSPKVKQTREGIQKLNSIAGMKVKVICNMKSDTEIFMQGRV